MAGDARSARYVVFQTTLSTGWCGRDWSFGWGQGVVGWTDVVVSGRLGVTCRDVPYVRSVRGGRVSGCRERRASVEDDGWFVMRIRVIVEPRAGGSD